MKKIDAQAGANSGVSPAAITAETAAAMHLSDLRNIRRSRLEMLIEQAYGGSAAEFSNRTGFSEAQVSQFLSTTYREGRSLDERAARNIEAKAGLQFGWLDQADSDARIPPSLQVSKSDARICASQIPAKAGITSAPRMAFHPKEHARLMRSVAHLVTSPVHDERAQPKFVFDESELQPGELYAGIVNCGGIYQHLILMPAEARDVNWQQAKTFAAAVGGELPDLGDYEALQQNLSHMFSDLESYWSSEWLDRKQALYLDFGKHPVRDWGSVEFMMRARAVRRTFAGREQSVLLNWHIHIKTMREAAGVTINRMAELMDVTPDVVERWESGEVRTMPGPILAEVCAVLNIDGIWLLGADDE